jgi:hypothetical protein
MKQAARPRDSRELPRPDSPADALPVVYVHFTKSFTGGGAVAPKKTPPTAWRSAHLADFALFEVEVRPGYFTPAVPSLLSGFEQSFGGYLGLVG